MNSGAVLYIFTQYEHVCKDTLCSRHYHTLRHIYSFPPCLQHQHSSVCTCILMNYMYVILTVWYSTLAFLTCICYTDTRVHLYTHHSLVLHYMYSLFGRLLFHPNPPSLDARHVFIFTLTVSLTSLLML